MYGRDYQARLERAGFTVTVDPYVPDLGADVARKHGLMADERIYLCRRHPAGPP